MTDPQAKPSALPAIDLEDGRLWHPVLMRGIVSDLSERVPLTTETLAQLLAALDEQTRSSVLAKWMPKIVESDCDECHGKGVIPILDNETCGDCRGTGFKQAVTPAHEIDERVKEAESRATRAEARVAELELALGAADAELEQYRGPATADEGAGSTKERDTCNRHDDCGTADEKARAAGRLSAEHCHDECCEDCFGN